jgi:hypothetical protein
MNHTTTEPRGPAASVTSTLLHTMAANAGGGPLLVANDGQLWLLCGAAGCPDRVLAIYEDSAATLAEIAAESTAHYQGLAHSAPTTGA